MWFLPTVRAGIAGLDLSDPSQDQSGGSQLGLYRISKDHHDRDHGEDHHGRNHIAGLAMEKSTTAGLTMQAHMP